MNVVGNRQFYEVEKRDILLFFLRYQHLNIDISQDTPKIQSEA